jgi:hypothetical protein
LKGRATFIRPPVRGDLKGGILMSRDRPVGISILAVLAAIAAVLAAINTLQYLHLLPFFLGPMTFFGFDPLAALLWALTTAAWIWAAVQLWNLNPQGWLFIIYLAALDLVLSFIALIGGTSFSSLVPSIVVSAAALIYCLTPGVKSAFGQPTG